MISHSIKNTNISLYKLPQKVGGGIQMYCPSLFNRCYMRLKRGYKSHSCVPFILVKGMEFKREELL